MTTSTFAPSPLIDSLITAVKSKRAVSGGMKAMMTRRAEFPSVAHAQLAGIAADPRAREFADDFLNDYWNNGFRRMDAWSSCATNREVIIGGGFHAAVYAAIRVLKGYPRPLVLERDDRAGVVSLSPINQRFVSIHATAAGWVAWRATREQV